jgi:hypothetical protein
MGDQEIRARAVVAVFGHLQVPIDWDGHAKGGSLMMWPGVRDALLEVEDYIRNGFDGPVQPYEAVEEDGFPLSSSSPLSGG